MMRARVLTPTACSTSELEPDAFVCINGEDLTSLGAKIGDEMRVASRRGTVTAKARLDDGLPTGTIFMPFCYAEAAANILTNAALDPESKIPEYKYAAVRLERAGTGDRIPESRMGRSSSAPTDQFSDGPV